ncbi:hypothetical protein KIPB_012276 [Kipferlia bialata]|uniref:Uncharacterized protein n=1 Tax=Kipferlia bialata TaxID=797122 RepID=A0A391NTD5_9EUKA|nr:hypothetical protein KIPB_012276 [Kipferlia bialata]|eukprot:g12276.t1
MYGGKSKELKNMHLTFTEAGGWSEETPLPFKVRGAAAISIGADIFLMGGIHHRKQVCSLCVFHFSLFN